MPNTAPAIATLIAWSIVRPVASMPPAALRGSAGAALMIALLFGGWNKALTERGDQLGPITLHIPVCSSSRARHTRPRRSSARPADLSQRVPIRSASRPLTGATTATTELKSHTASDGGIAILAKSLFDLVANASGDEVTLNCGARWH